MVKYQLRAVSLLNLVNDVKMERLVPDAYFQRDLVWREIHKKDFIRTILLGLPFPQMFISRGKIDVESMKTVSCIVDGQQRTNAIMEYINNSFEVDSKCYKDLSDAEKSEFLKYEIAVIELDLDNDDPLVKEVFLRINRASNSLTSIEKMSTQYSTSELMLVAKMLVDDLVFPSKEVAHDDDDLRVDPNVPTYFYEWAKGNRARNFQKLILTKHIFDSREISKKVHLSYSLNILVTYLGGFYKRNEKLSTYLNDYASELPDKNEVTEIIDSAAGIYLSLKLKPKGYWYNKANFFSLIIALANFVSQGSFIDKEKLSSLLSSFETNPPEAYKSAASQAVNDLQTRILRNKYLVEIIEQCV